MGSCIIGTGIAGRICGRARRTSLRQRLLGHRQTCLGSRISSTGVSGWTRGQARPTSLRKRLMGSRISGPGGAGQIGGRVRHTILS